MYEVRHTVDVSGARYSDCGPSDYTGHDLDAAIKVADELTAAGQCGYVINMRTSERLIPDGTWA